MRLQHSHVGMLLAKEKHHASTKTDQEDATGVLSAASQNPHEPHACA